VLALYHDWLFWARLEQLPPDDDWKVWLFLGGRGAGKTRAGAEWVRLQISAGCRRIGLIAPTLSDAREVMIGGPSGLAHIGPAEDRPRFEISRKRLVWPNGAEGYVFSAEDPDSLRGPQFDAAWADEFAAWSYPQETLDTLRMGLRLGENPQLMVTTTPRPIPALKSLLGQTGVALTQASTQDNAAYQGEDIKPLAPAHLKARRLANGFRVHWKRRARIGGDDWVSPELPLKEEAERYLIELVAGGEVHHSEEVTTSNFDLQEADLENWIATPLPSFDIIVHQISGQYGPGDPASLTITP